MKNGEFELYNRIITHRKKAKLREQQEVTKFIEAIDKGEYPFKCLECYELGIRNCRWWTQNFECESHEGEKTKEKIKAFFK